MGYQIQYGASMVKTRIPERRNLSSYKYIKYLIVACVILFAIFLGSREEVQNFLLPGNGNVTRSAISKMVSNLKDGAPLAASIEVFCLEIVNGARIPQ